MMKQDMFRNRFLKGAGKGATGIAAVVGVILYMALMLFIYGAMIVGAVYFFLFVTGHFHHAKPASNQTVTSYVATQDNFKINFAGVPTITDTTPGSDYTGRVYDVTNQTTNVEQDVLVYDYSDFNANSVSQPDLQSDLQSNLNSVAQGYKSAISNSEIITFQGLTAIQATLTPSDTSVEDSDIIMFYKGSDVYSIIDSGVNQSVFESFASSFKFLN